MILLHDSEMIEDAANNPASWTIIPYIWLDVHVAFPEVGRFAERQRNRPVAEMRRVGADAVDRTTGRGDAGRRCTSRWPAAPRSTRRWGGCRAEQPPERRSASVYRKGAREVVRRLAA
jgi:hypothetical protein